MPRSRRITIFVVISASAMSAGYYFVRSRLPVDFVSTLAPVFSASASVSASAGPAACESPPVLRLLHAPSAFPARLTCDAAREIAKEARDGLAQPPPRVDSRAFGEATTDWLDPHGLWSAAPDAPIGALVSRASKKMLSSLENEADLGGCEAAEQIGLGLESWVTGLRAQYDKAFVEASTKDPGSEFFRIASENVFEDGQVKRSAREFAQDLGHRNGTVVRAMGSAAELYAKSARDRLFPQMTSGEWGETLLAAAIRAYVLQIDPHGAWAPLDEETSLYEVELEGSGRTRIWQKMSRSAIGIKIEQGALAPLKTEDLVLSIGGIATAGLSVEQAEQHGIIDPEDVQPDRDVVVLRQGHEGLLALKVSLGDSTDSDLSTSLASVSSQILVERVSYGSAEALVLGISDVPDDLGENLQATLKLERSKAPWGGLVLDLRGNGGGSTDGARNLLGIFIPESTLFPMRRRDGVVEVERAPKPNDSQVYSGPMAVIVDGDTASAAEMIAGALLTYRRAVVLGAKTFGKGCAQEYMDDSVGVGVLRLSTLVYALPDGAPVQRAGIRPDFLLNLPSSGEREASLTHALLPWRGPDLRGPKLSWEVPWPSHGGHLGSCKDEVVCKALRTVGLVRSATARSVSSR